MDQSFRDCAATIARTACFFAVVAGQSLPAGAGERLTLTASPTGAMDEIVVLATNGRPDRIEKGSFRTSLVLEAAGKDADGGYKILSSELSLKNEGSSGARSIQTMTGQSPQDNFKIEKQVTLEFDSRGPTAQNAISVCAGLKGGAKSASSSAQMTTALLWTVKSGRFNYRWTMANMATPTREMLDNPDYYSDQETEVLELPLSVTVRCEGLSDAVAGLTKDKAEKAKAQAVKATQAQSAPAQSPPSQSKQIETAEIETSSSTKAEKARLEPAHIAPASEPDTKGASKVSRTSSPAQQEPRAPVAAAESDETKFQCDGGMVRQVSSAPTSFVCLCPGNTVRKELGASRYVCEKRLARR